MRKAAGNYKLEAKFLFTQFLAILGAVLYFFSYQFRDNRKLYAMQFFSYVVYTAHFIILGAMTGGFSYILNLARTLFLASKWEFVRSNKMCVILCFMQVIVLFTTWVGWISLLPICANIASTIGGYTHNARKIRIAGVFINSPLWIIYDVIIGSWAGVIDELASMVSGVISIWRYGWNNLNEINEGNRRFEGEPERNEKDGGEK